MKIQFSAHIVPVPSEQGETKPPSTLYRSVDRQWPSVPRKGDVVSLGGGDQLVEDVRWVEFLDGKVVLHFQMNQDDRQFLVDLGFEPAA